ncbi:MAG: hypothetical protein OFPII_40730 [Osedax symbiont Rs1]|nr:MAG: hypothetical protein OFPII_40730 [Osedax symbiont Rs1]
MHKLIALYPVAVLLLGCAGAPTTQISAFGDSTKAISEKVDAVLNEYNQEYLTREFTSYAATYTGKNVKHLTIAELSKIVVPISAMKNRGFAIFRANKAIGSYAKSLSALARASSQVDIDLAAADLYGAFTSLNSQYKVLNGSELFSSGSLAASSKFIAAIGSAIVEEKRRKAIKGIVIEADKKIGLMCDEIYNQLEESGFEDGIVQARKYVLLEELGDYKIRIDSIKSLDKRRMQIKRLYELQQNVMNSKLLIQQTQKAVKLVKSSHATLAAELKKDRFTSASISLAIGKLKNLEKHYDDFEALLLSCKTEPKILNGVLVCDNVVQ